MRHLNDFTDAIPVNVNVKNVGLYQGPQNTEGAAVGIPIFERFCSNTNRKFTKEGTWMIKHANLGEWNVKSSISDVIVH